MSPYTAISILLFLCIDQSASVNCPSECKCHWELDSLVVDCSNRGLEDYPIIEEGLPVEHLDLSNNYFQEFPSIYANIHSLIYLDLAANDIQEIPEDALVGFDSLRTLILANNSFKSWTDIHPNVALQHAYSLQSLSLFGNNLLRFSDNNGAPALVSDSLRELDLSHCAITEVNIKSGGTPNLEKLNLSGNKLITLTSHPFKYLRFLNLSNCSLEWLPEPLMNNLLSLEVIDVSFNPGLASESFQTLERKTLREINLSFCNLDSLTLKGFPNLMIAVLRGNMIRSVSKELFENNAALEMLDLSRNAIRSIDALAFSNLRKLTILDLSYNEIYRLDRNQFRNNDALVTINLSRNIFNEFPRLISNSLRSVNLSWCEILSIESSVFTGFKTLVSLDLSNNLIAAFPTNMKSETLKKLDLSMCRLSIIRNETFQGFPELASLNLSGNRFTNPIPPEYFMSNIYLNQIWLADNTWRCDCHDHTFMSFYDWLTDIPPKLKDKANLRCSSPTVYFGKTWEAACLAIWYPTKNDKAAQKVWSIMMVMLLIMGCSLCIFSCVRKFLHRKIKQRNRQERDENEAELQEIRRQNTRILSQTAQQNAPTANDPLLPSYEDAVLMPKLERTSKSLMDLSKPRKQLSRTKTESDFEDSVLDHHRFRSEELLSNRDKERTTYIEAFRRTGRIDYNPSGSRRFSIEDSRFPAAHLKSQNLQSAERIGNFQSYENSPYTKRRPKPPPASVFKRASIRDSVEFLTDSEINSKPGSPFAQRRPPPQETSVSTLSLQNERTKGKVPADKSFHTVEEYFGRDVVDNKPKSVDSSLSDFQVMRSSDVDLSSNADSNSRHSDGPVVVIHAPIRESKF